MLQKRRLRARADKRVGGRSHPAHDTGLLQLPEAFEREDDVRICLSSADVVAAVPYPHPLAGRVDWDRREGWLDLEEIADPGDRLLLGHAFDAEGSTW